jgi:hypothetical protein
MLKAEWLKPQKAETGIYHGLDGYTRIRKETGENNSPFRRQLNLHSVLSSVPIREIRGFIFNWADSYRSDQ